MTLSAGPPLSVLIVDDEPLARDVLRRLLAAHPDLAIRGECRDGREAVAAIRAQPAADLLFLDVQMPELDGFGVLREIGPERMPAVIFTTAYDEFAVRAFEVQALDYLVKPFTDERFEDALSRARRQLAAARALDRDARLAALLADPAIAAAPPPAERLLVPAGQRSIVVRTAEITWIRADDYYVSIFWQGKSYLLRETLADLERRLDHRAFVRVHRSAIVNIGAVQELRHAGSGTVAVLRDGTRVPVSRSRREHLARALGGSASS